MLSILWKQTTCSYIYSYVINFEKKESNNDNGVINLENKLKRRQ